jgi:hypothetical protein
MILSFFSRMIVFITLMMPLPGLFVSFFEAIQSLERTRSRQFNP